jgi:hypothetical protein
MTSMHLWVRHAVRMAYDRPIKDQVPPTASIMAPATPFCFWMTQKHLTVKRTMGLTT